MAQSTTNLGKIHVFPSETLYNQFKDIIADNDLALLKDDGAYIVAALLEQNGYVKFSNGLILQWGVINAPDFPSNGQAVTFPINFSKVPIVITAINQAENSVSSTVSRLVTSLFPHCYPIKECAAIVFVVICKFVLGVRLYA